MKKLFTLITLSAMSFTLFAQVPDTIRLTWEVLPEQVGVNKQIMVGGASVTGQPFTIFWGDGTSDPYTTQVTNTLTGRTHAYSSTGIYTVKIAASSTSYNLTNISLESIASPVHTLDVSGATKLERLYVSNNPTLTNLDISGLTALTFFQCSNNQWTSLDISNNTALTNLQCYNNQLTSLDISNNTALTSLQCYNNQLTSLDLSNITGSLNLMCYDNQITDIIYPVGKTATSIRVYNNKLSLSKLDVLCRFYATGSAGSKQLLRQDLDTIYANVGDIIDLTEEKTINGHTSTFDVIEGGTYDETNGYFTPYEEGIYIIKMTNSDAFPATVVNASWAPEVYQPVKVTCTPVTNIANVPATATIGVPLSLNGTVQPSGATNPSPIVWSINTAEPNTAGASLTGNTLKTTTSGKVTVTAKIVNGKCGADYEDDFEITVGCASGIKHQLPNPSQTPEGSFNGNNFTPQYNPQTNHLKAWVLYNHQCGEISINVLENALTVGSQFVDENTTEHIPLDGCGHLIIFPMNENLSSSSQPSLDFSFYLVAKPLLCIGSPTPAPPVDGKRFTKGLIESPIIIDYGINIDGALPISLLHFGGNCNNGVVRLNWVTASETNNDYFTVERGESNGNTKAIRWSKVAEIKGAGNSSMPLSYSYSDNSPFEGGKGDVVYYRLKQTDYNGQYEYFSPIVVNCEAMKNKKFIIYPNPTRGVLTIKLSNMEKENADFKIYDIVGKLVLEGRMENNTINTESLKKGMYYVVIEGEVAPLINE